MRKKGILIVFTLGFLLSYSFLTPAEASDARITGLVVGFDRHTVTLSQRGNRRIKVPRKSIPSHFEIKMGRKVSSVVPRKDFLATLKKAQKEQHKKSKAQKK